MESLGILLGILLDLLLLLRTVGSAARNWASAMVNLDMLLGEL